MVTKHVLIVYFISIIFPLITKTVRPKSLTCLTHSLIEMLDIYRNSNPMKQKLNIKPDELNQFSLLVFKMAAGFLECS